MHRARCLRDLAEAAGEGTVAVDIEDFNAIAKFYRKLM